ncbi:MAG TPA: UDP-glucose/GDP-mannose dehydrogenase family protein [Anaerolineaceae bacterium]|nr:UDP-glucose/GDP-mannose dehydrogenase family protein [Anaerolineaceae bacterium]
MRVLIIGTGYVGLNTGVALAYLGNQVICLDVNAERIAQLQAGIPPFYEPQLAELLPLVARNLNFASSYAQIDLAKMDVAFIAVGTPSNPDGSANLDYLRKAAEDIAANLSEDSHLIVINKSTVPIGSGNWVAAIIREKYQQLHQQSANGLDSVVSMPEFLKQGEALRDSLYPDRVVIGSDSPEATQKLLALYEDIIQQKFEAPAGLPRPEGLQEVPVLVCDLVSAEMIKYAANAFLALKISYINEIGHLTAKVGGDIKAVAAGIGMDKRIGPAWLDAGIGWGGSCFGKDTAALVSTAAEYRVDMPIIKAARAVNYGLRAGVVEALKDHLKVLKGKHVAILGFSFKPETDDLRDSPSVDIAKGLLQRGVLVQVHDPVALNNARSQYKGMGIAFCDTVEQAVQGADAIILATAWREYLEMDWSLLPRVLVFDGRNVLDREKLTCLGFEVISVG